MSREVDLDAIVGTEALVIKLNGREYVIEDIPLDMFLAYTQSVDKALDVADLAYRLLRNLDPNITHEEIKKMGIRKLRSLLALVMGHFGSLPKDVNRTLAEMGPAAARLADALTGLG